ncbi:MULTISPECIES: hypothetical protein [Niastella]|uniref:Uncharacterized protein n=1 Tax=Niastella soli TaxID=2821487 RepID=A0ABS3YVU5_9BACT|nr:hypothetical protein [Niastella soli]MBO9202052.1 hypothetical protein [Niastella soli]
MIVYNNIENGLGIVGGVAQREYDLVRKLESDTLLKKVDCIIHTTNPKALKKKGITVISVSPWAVTAVATPAQPTNGSRHAGG